MSKVWFITGSSRGLGRALVTAALEAGHRVVATARQPEQFDDLVSQHGDRIHPVKLDVRSPQDAQQAVTSALAAFGRIDVVVNNAGYGFTGAFEEMSAEDFRGQIDTNFWGVVHITRAVLPHLRRQGSGHLIQITSIGGRLAVAGLSGYHAAKFAVEGLSEALAQEVRPFGVKIVIIEPGGFRTDWAGPSMDYAPSMPEYEASMGMIREFMRTHGPQVPGDPRKAARVILQVAEMSDPPLRLPLGNDAIALLSRAYETNTTELQKWAPLTKSTDFDGLATSDTENAALKLLERS